MIRHDCFIGRFVTFHDGHLYIMQKVYNKNVNPLLILIMDTDEQPNALTRKKVIKTKLKKLNISNKIQIIPPISSVNYGRGGGYGINYIEAPRSIKNISGTKIRNKLCH